MFGVGTCVGKQQAFFFNKGHSTTLVPFGIKSFTHIQIFLCKKMYHFKSSFFARDVHVVISNLNVQRHIAMYKTFNPMWD